MRNDTIAPAGLGSLQHVGQKRVAVQHGYCTKQPIEKGGIQWVARPGGEAEYGFERRSGRIAVTERFPYKLAGSIRNVSRAPPLKPSDKWLLHMNRRDAVNRIDELNTVRLGKPNRQRLKKTSVRLGAWVIL